MNINFDEDPNNLVAIFVHSGLAGFRAIDGAREKTIELLQKFTTFYLSGSKFIHMFFEKDGSVTLATNNNVELQFGTKKAMSDSVSNVYITAKQECEGHNVESTITAETEFQQIFQESKPSSFSRNPDKVVTETIKSGDTVIYDIQKFLIFDDRVEQVYEVDNEVANLEQ